MTAVRCFVVGDIHGCVEELDRLLDGIDAAPADTIVFLGDYIDRGPSSRAVIDRLLRLQREGPRCVFLRGNHEDMFLGFLGQGGAYGEAFLLNGGRTTLRSYGLEPQSSPGFAAERLPAEHVEFLKATRLHHEHGRFFCVHAGLVPTRALSEQRAEDMLWIRDEFISSPHPFPFTVLFGHTPRRDVLVDLPYKIGLDTGLVYWNKLSCLELEECRLFQIRRGERQIECRRIVGGSERAFPERVLH